MELNGYAKKFEQQSIALPRSEWEEILDRFLLRLNPGRIEAKYPPYTHARLAKLLSGIGIKDAPGAYKLYNDCDKARSFSRLFSSKVGPKKA